MPSRLVPSSLISALALGGCRACGRSGEEARSRPAASIESGAAGRAHDALEVRDEFPHQAGLRAATKLAVDLAKERGGFAWDGVTQHLFRPAELETRRLERCEADVVCNGWQGDLPSAPLFFVVQYHKEGARHRAVTSGLAALGVPDLVIEDVPEPNSIAATVLVNGIAQRLIEGASIGEGGVFQLDLKEIQHKSVRAALGGGWP